MRAQSKLFVPTLLELSHSDIDLCHRVFGLQLIGLGLHHFQFVGHFCLLLLTLYVSQTRWHAFLRLIDFALLLKHGNLHDFIVRIDIVFIERDKLLAFLSNFTAFVLGDID